jgi:hypothetical protein
MHRNDREGTSNQLMTHLTDPTSTEKRILMRSLNGVDDGRQNDYCNILVATSPFSQVVSGR